MTSAEATGYHSSSRHNLPIEAAGFIGRERELAEIKSILLHTRLLTLTGAGGAGKTRLALRLAGHVAPGFADGVWLVPLAPVSDSSMVVRAIATAVGVRGSAGRSLLATLATALASRRLLLVLDNCEHLIGACARAAETLLGAAPHLRILATSREPLRVAGETVWRVPPLAQPDAEQVAPEALAAVESVQLFLERARARRPDFALTDRNAPAVAAICRKLDGLPLAIELAAAQIAALTPEEISARLDDSLHVLSGGHRTLPRQETLRAALDWSHALLTESEQILFRRLAVFSGGFDVRAAEAVGSGDGIERSEALPELVDLVEKSLIEAESREGGTRYRLLEPVRQYAWEHLLSSGEQEAIQRRHAFHFVEVAEEAEPRLMSGERGASMERLEIEQNNLRAALGWSRGAAATGDIELGLRLAGALPFFWNLRGETNEGLDWMEALLAAGPEASPGARGKALWGAGELAWMAGQPELGRVRAEQAEQIFRALGDRRLLAYTLQSLPMATEHPRARESVEEALRLFSDIGDEWGSALALGAADLFPLLRDGDSTGKGRALLEEGLARARAVKDDWLVAMRLNFLGDLARSQGDGPAATQHDKEAISLLRRQDLTGTVPSLLHNLGYLALRRQDIRQALGLFRESLVLFRNQGDQRGVADCLIGLGSVTAAMGRPEQAAQLFGAAETLREMTGAAIWPSNLPEYERGLAMARARLDEAAFAGAWREGRELRPGEAVARALGGHEPGSERAGSAETSLSPRECEVAAMVAQGMTNRQIGAALFITEGTARLHVRHILQKLGFSSRAQIAAWAVEKGMASIL